MSLAPHLLFYNSQTLGKHGSIENILLSLQHHDYLLYDFQVGMYPTYDARWSNPSHFTYQIVQTVYKKNGISFHAKRKSEKLEFLIQVDWNIELKDIDGGKKYSVTSAISFQTGSFRPEEETSIIYSLHFIEFGKLLFSLIQPDFGWIDLNDPPGYTWFDAINNLAIPHVYWANFFGEAYTNKYGLSNLLDSPAWRVDPLINKGALIVLSPFLGIRSDSELEAVEKHIKNIMKVDT